MALEYKDYYRILGVPRNASKEEIRKAFRKLAREHHPDIAKDKQSGEARFKEINEAYEVLSDPEKRRRYDSLGADWSSAGGFKTPPGWQQRTGAGHGPGGFEDFAFEFGGTGFSDFFEQFFGSMSGRRRHGTQDTSFDSGPPRGQDIEGDLQVTLREALQGSTRPVSLRHTSTCESCKGTGQLQQQPCRACSGKGTTQTVKQYQIKIPPGVRDGHRLRLAGKGEEGYPHGPKGDLYLRVRLVKHPDFQVEGSDLHHELLLAPWEAVLGTQVTVPTLDAPVSIRIPPSSQTGQKLRIRGRGLVNPKGTRGDLLVTLRVQVPADVTDQERKLWKELSETSRFRPRDN